MKILAMLALLLAAVGCTETRVGRSTLDDKYGGMDASKGSRPVNSGGSTGMGSGNPLPWKGGFKAY